MGNFPYFIFSGVGSHVLAKRQNNSQHTFALVSSPLDHNGQEALAAFCLFSLYVFNRIVWIYGFSNVNMLMVTVIVLHGMTFFVGSVKNFLGWYATMSSIQISVIDKLSIFFNSITTYASIPVIIYTP